MEYVTVQTIVVVSNLSRKPRAGLVSIQQCSAVKKPVISPIDSARISEVNCCVDAIPMICSLNEFLNGLR